MAAATKDFSALDALNAQVEGSKVDVLKKRIEELQAENEHLRCLHQKNEKETHEFVAYFQRELGAREKVTAKLSEDLSEARTKFHDETEEMKVKYDVDTKHLVQTSKLVEHTLSDKLKIAQEDLAKLELFRDMKESLEKKLQQLTDTLDSERVAHKDAIGMMERKFLEEKARHQKDTDKRIEKIKQQSREDARNVLDADTRKIVTDNKRMGEELRFQLQTTEELTKDKIALEHLTKSLKCEIQVHADKELEYAKYGQKQTREIKQLQAKVKTLEKSLCQVVHAFEKEKVLLATKTEKELDDVSLDADGLRKLLKLKNKELRNMKRLAQTILDQRTDVEQFFLDSLDMVKQQLVDERKRTADAEKVQDAKLTPAERGLKFPRLKTRSSAGNQQPPLGPRDKVDLRALTWEERERVLRLLFAKINSIQGFLDVPPPLDDARSSTFDTPFITEVADPSGPSLPRHFPSRPPTHAATPSDGY
ncbi:hypothetical protein, variant 2 [Aphanomyces invadans]|uniref:Uncharacterized protein n=1 Tax=Aphanomyces invadans TaxID=157072 RepID=A0A024TVH4_9STRA|nr:hypothetical protein, variant 2 [Aphanomyces invadans]ETV97626.1 hypothetical protein, variant 2 [Aphanomyces invadans]|eukprot:XP_008873835.1 hypothetical protein, variant 2 [Aphanomyces invadans]